MDMIGHQAPGKDLHAKAVALFLDELQIAMPVRITAKNIHRTHATLGDVMGITDCDHS